MPSWTSLSSLINFSTSRHKLLGLLFHPHAQCRLFIDLFLRRVLAHVLRDLHGTEMRTAHRTEVGELRAFLRQSFVVVFARDFRVERQIELIFPAKLKT